MNGMRNEADRRRTQTGAAGETETRTGRRRPSVWVDLVSPSHPFFFDALLKRLPDVDVTATARQKTETVTIANSLGIRPRVVGQDLQHPALRPFGIPLRTAQLAARAPKCDVSLSSRNVMCILASKARGVPSIHFTDNDVTAYIDGLTQEELYHRLEGTATYNVVPESFRQATLASEVLPSSQVFTYDGYKEDVSVAAFDPDPTFTDRLPFEEFVVVRPEALTASYVAETDSLIPDLLAGFASAGVNVVYLPRGRGDESYADEYGDAVFVPDDPLDGLQLAWHATCVLTGSGTMAREAACMGKPAVSFFPHSLLSVDRKMVEEGRVYHSRDPDAILDYVVSLTPRRIEPDRSRSKDTYEDVADLTEDLIRRCLD